MIRRKIIFYRCVRFFSDPYRILGVDRSASKADVRSQFLRQARIWHPDNHANRSLEEQEMASKKYKEIREAYEILSGKDTGPGGSTSRSAHHARQHTAHHYNYQRYQEEEDHEWVQRQWTLRTYGLQYGPYLFVFIVFLFYIRARYTLEQFKDEQSRRLPEQDADGVNVAPSYKRRKMGQYPIEEDGFRAMSASTGVKPIRTGSGYDWTPVHMANKQLQEQGASTNFDNLERQKRLREVKEQERQKQNQGNLDYLREKREEKKEKIKKKKKKKSTKKKMEEMQKNYHEIIVKLESRVANLETENDRLRKEVDVLKNPA